MKPRILTALLSLLTISIVSSASVHAQVVGVVIDPIPAPPVLATSPIIITAAATGANGPQFVQLYNNTDTVQDIRGWSLRYVASNLTDEYQVDLATFTTWVMPRGYIVIAAEGAVTGADKTYILPVDIAAQITPLPTRTLRLVAPTGASIAPVVLVPTALAPQWQERNKSTSTGKYLETYTTKTGSAQLLGGGLYVPLEDTAGLRIVEIFANARDCSPLDTALDCGDYVKLYNSSGVPIELSDYRLRTDSGGSKSSSSNTFSLTGQLAPDSFLTVRLKDSKEPLSITNDGGYVWLEDTYGVQVYEPIIAYPDATSKQGQSWAYETASDTWILMVPAPDAPNYWPPAPPVTVVAVAGVSITSSTTELADCGEGRERNPETNRCRTIVTAATSTLTPCGPGQERNPETNRCKSIVVAAATLTPCGPDQDRNPETNRCRSILTAASTTLSPCPAGQERNPETNRCRKVGASAIANVATITDVESIEQPNPVSWLIAGSAVVVAIAYAIYEWRVDIVRRLREIKR